MVAESLVVEAIFKDQLTGGAKLAAESIAEFGGSADQTAAAIARLDAVAGKTGKGGLALTANALRTLADESEDADGALKNLDLALKLAERQMLKTEDAGRLLGRVMRGDVSALKELSPAAAKAADAIGKIPNASERARLGMEVVRREARGVVSDGDGIGAVFGRADASLARFGITGLSTASVLGGVATAAGAATVAVGKLTFDAMMKFQQSTDQGRVRLERFNNELARLETTVGRAASEATSFDSVIETNTARAKALTDTYTESEYVIDNFAGGIADLGVTLFAIINPLKLVALAGYGAVSAFDALIGTEEALADVTRQAVGPAGDIGSAIGSAVGPTDAMASSAGTLGQALSFLGDDLRLTSIDAQNFATSMAAAASYLGNDGRPLPIGPNMADGTFVKEAPKKRGSGAGGGARKLPGEGTSLTLPARMDNVTTMDTVDALSGLGGAASFFEAKAVRPTFEADMRARDREFAADEEKAARRAERMKEKREDDARIKKMNDDLAKSTEKLQDEYTALQTIGTGAMDALVGSTFDLVDALATSEMKLKDVGGYIGGTFSTILSDMGEELAMHAIKQGAIYAAFGEAMTALAAGSPGAAIVAGLALMAVGTAGKAFFSKKGGGGGARGADNRAAGAVERLGRGILGRADEAARPVYLSIEGRTVRGYMTDVMDDAMRRGQVNRTPRRV